VALANGGVGREEDGGRSGGGGGTEHRRPVPPQGRFGRRRGGQIFGADERGEGGKRMK